MSFNEVKDNLELNIEDPFQFIPTPITVLTTTTTSIENIQTKVYKKNQLKIKSKSVKENKETFNSDHDYDDVIYTISSSRIFKLKTEKCKLNTIEHVKVVYIGSPISFWVRRYNDCSRLNALSSEIDEFVNKVETNQILSKDIYIG